MCQLLLLYILSTENLRKNLIWLISTNNLRVRDIYYPIDCLRLNYLNNELQIASTSYPRIEDICEVEDSLVIARDKYPGQRNSLDALAQRFDVTGYDRTFHGALLDANILADVFMQLTGGQSKFEFMTNGNSYSDNKSNSLDFDKNLIKDLVKVKTLTKDELDQEESKLSAIEKKHNKKPIWRKFQ